MAGWSERETQNSKHDWTQEQEDKVWADSMNGTGFVNWWLALHFCMNTGWRKLVATCMVHEGMLYFTGNCKYMS